MRYDGRHLWLVGASTGIGRELARELARRGAKLTLSARSLDKLVELKEEIGDAVAIAPLDVSDPQAIKSTAAGLENLDGVVYMAAAYQPDSKSGLFDAGRMEQTIRVNLIGAIYVVEACKDILRHRPGSLLAIYASIAGYRGLPNGQPYSATKAGLINYAESLRSELAGEVLVKVINSGFVDTRLTQKNEFEMPMLLTPAAAAGRIADKLGKPGFEIAFPTRFALVAKLLRICPNWLFFWISKRLR
jgi:short-subunit dehydrogenase